MALMLQSALIYFVLGVLFGYLGGLFGIGGGLIAIPVLGVFFGYSEQVAQGTALVMIVPNVLLGLWNYIRKVGLDTRLAMTLAATAVPFTFAGARVATVLPSAPSAHCVCDLYRGDCGADGVAHVWPQARCMHRASYAVAACGLDRRDRRNAFGDFSASAAPCSPCRRCRRSLGSVKSPRKAWVLRLSRPAPW